MCVWVLVRFKIYPKTGTAMCQFINWKYLLADAAQNCFALSGMKMA